MNIIALTPEFWAALGLSPMEAVLAIAVVGLWTWSKIALKEQKTLRESWHAETRREVDELKNNVKEHEAHIATCDRDRLKLSVENASIMREMETLKILIQAYRACNATDCPNRGKGLVVQPPI